MKFEIINEEIKNDINGESLVFLKNKNMYRRMIDKLFNKNKNLLVNMILPAGIDSFYIKDSINNFNYKKGTYIMDKEAIITNKATKNKEIFYHKGISAPLTFDFISENNIKNQLEDDSKFEQVSASINPEVIYNFMVTKVVEQMVKGADTDKLFKSLRLYLMIIVLLTAASLLLQLQVSGILNSIGL